MPHCPQSPPWRLEGGGQVLDLDTAVKDGVLGGGRGGGGGGGVAGAEKLDLGRMIEALEAETEEEVPAVFICPISLEPMVDPVTLCTGQTYERANILRWLAVGRSTCPTTMQELWDDALTPNRTLQQLIHAWFARRYARFRKRAEDVQGRAAELVAALRGNLKGQARVRALKDLHRLAATHPAVRNSLASDANAFAFLSALLGPFTSHAVGSVAVAMLVDLPIDSEAKANLMQPAKISLVIDILNEGSIETKINCTRFIQMLIELKSFRPETVSSLSLLVGLLRLVKDRRHPNGISAGFRLLKAICAHGQVRSSVVTIGAVPQLVALLPNLNPDCLESALQILVDLSSIPEGLSALKGCPESIPYVVRVLMRVSEACTRSALWILWAVCELAPEDCAPTAVEAGLATKLLLVMQSGCCPEIKQRASELLKLCSLNYNASQFISKCKLTRTMQ